MGQADDLGGLEGGAEAAQTGERGTADHFSSLESLKQLVRAGGEAWDAVLQRATAERWLQ